MKISVKQLKIAIQILLDCSLCIGAYFLWVNALSFITFTYLLIVSALGYILSNRINDSIKISKVTIIWCAYLIYLIFNVILSSDISKSTSFAKLLTAMILCTIIFAKNESNSKMAGYLLIVMALILSLSVMWEFLDYSSFQNVAQNLFTLDLYIEISKLRGSFNRYVGFGVYSGPTACLIIYGMCAAITYLKKNIIFYVIMGIDIVAIVLTGSRTLLLLFIIVWMCYVFYMRTKKEKKITKKKIFLYSILLVVAVLVGGNFIIKNASNLRLLDGTATDASVNTRFLLYAYAINLFINNPVVGTGINTYLNFSSNNMMLESTYTHNLILQSLAEQGIIGCILLIGAILFTFIYIIRTWKRGIKTNSMKFSILVQIVFLVYSMVGNPFYDINLRLVYFVGVMIGLRECKKNLKEKKIWET